MTCMRKCHLCVRHTITSMSKHDTHRLFRSRCRTIYIFKWGQSHLHVNLYMHPSYCKTSQCFHPLYNVESTIGTGFRFIFCHIFSSSHIIWKWWFSLWCKSQGCMQSILELFVSAEQWNWFLQFWRTYFSFILMSATFWRMSNFPMSTLASTWDELSKLDQTLQLSCGTSFLEKI